jgi:hypothetical protein
MQAEIQVETSSKAISTIPSEKQATRLLPRLDAKRAVSLLREFLNCDFESVRATERFFRRFGDLCPRDVPAILVLQLKAAWKEPNVHGRDSYLYAAAAQCHRAAADDEGDDEAVRRYDSLAAAIVYALKNSDRLRVCASDACLSPFFVAVNRNQKFCSSECAAPSIRASKKEWWAKERARRREAGKKKSTRKVKGVRGND